MAVAVGASLTRRYLIHVCKTVHYSLHDPGHKAPLGQLKQLFLFRCQWLSQRAAIGAATARTRSSTTSSVKALAPRAAAVVASSTSTTPSTTTTWTSSQSAVNHGGTCKQEHALRCLLNQRCSPAGQATRVQGFRYDPRQVDHMYHPFKAVRQGCQLYDTRA